MREGIPIESHKIGYSEYGSILIGDLRFVTGQEYAEMVTDDSAGMSMEKIKYDIYNNDNNSHGYLDIYFSDCINWCFVDWRRVHEDGDWKVRIINQPIWTKFDHFTGDRKELILRIAEYAAKIHNEQINLNSKLWIKPANNLEKDFLMLPFDQTVRIMKIEIIKYDTIYNNNIK